MSEHDSTEVLTQHAQAIAKAMGAPWRYEVEREHWPTRYLADGSGARVWVRWEQQHSSKAPRLFLCGEFPSGYRGDRASITVRVDRGAEKVAAEIKRRLLPVYLPLWKAATEADATAKAEQAAALALAAELAEVLDASPSHHDKTRFWFSLPHGDGVCDVSPGDRVTLQLRGVDAETARAVAKLLSEVR